MVTLTDQSELTTALCEDHQFLSRFIDSDRLCRRWRCTRRYLRDRQRKGLIPRARWVLGKLRYRIVDIEAAERQLTEGT
jgi:hypothetical protein